MEMKQVEIYLDNGLVVISQEREQEQVFIYLSNEQIPLVVEWLLGAIKKE